MKCLVVLIAILVLGPAVDAAGLDAIFIKLLNLFQNVPQPIISTTQSAIQNAFDEAGKGGSVNLPSGSVFKIGGDKARKEAHLKKAEANGCTIVTDDSKCTKEGKFFCLITGATVCCKTEVDALNSEALFIHGGDRTMSITSSGCMKGACELLDFTGKTDVNYRFEYKGQCYCSQDRCKKDSDCKKNYGTNSKCENGACHFTDRKCTEFEKSSFKKCPKDSDNVIFRLGKYYCCDEKMSFETLMAARGVTIKTKKTFCTQTSSGTAKGACEQINMLYDLNTYREDYDSILSYCCNDFCTKDSQCDEKTYGKGAVCGQGQCVFGNRPVCEDAAKDGIQNCLSKSGTFALLSGTRKCCTGANDMQVMALKPTFYVSKKTQCTKALSAVNCGLARYRVTYSSDYEYCCQDNCKTVDDCKENYGDRQMKCSANICSPKESVTCENNDKEFGPCVNGGNVLVVRKPSAGGNSFKCCKTGDPELAIGEIGREQIDRIFIKKDGGMKQCSVCDRCGDNLESYKC